MCDCAELSTKGDSEALRRNRSLLDDGGGSAIVQNSVPKAIAKRSAGIAEIRSVKKQVSGYRI
jgi:hypothetical protein